MNIDPVSDMLTRIRNAIRIERPFVDVPVSGLRKSVADVLKREGYIWDYAEVEGEPAKMLRIELKYGPNGEKIIQTIKRISRPGRRVYAKCGDLKPVLNGMGISIVSTSKGVYSDREARQHKLGGEVLAEVC
ncbi:MAG: 30S ribosomal protein S8 [Planctomycetes bacterium]|nr:30S ribosomal protein S8 [Planctomycetota bacterium]